MTGAGDIASTNGNLKRSEAGGSVLESNSPEIAELPLAGFEDRKGHRTPFASAPIQFTGNIFYHSATKVIDKHYSSLALTRFSFSPKSPIKSAFISVISGKVFWLWLRYTASPCLCGGFDFRFLCLLRSSVLQRFCRQDLREQPRFGAVQCASISCIVKLCLPASASSSTSIWTPFSSPWKSCRIPR